MNNLGPWEMLIIGLTLGWVAGMFTALVFYVRDMRKISKEGCDAVDQVRDTAIGEIHRLRDKVITPLIEENVRLRHKLGLPLVP